MLTRQEIVVALREERMKQLMHGHDWDVADVMAVLDEQIEWDS